VDPPLGTAISADERGREEKAIPFILRPWLFQGGFEDSLSLRTYSSIRQMTNPALLV
jgi:hypothetical protein